MKQEIAFDDLPATVGRTFGPTAPFALSQQVIAAFADLTNDHQWVHVEVERARHTLGHTLAHGYLILSLIPQFTEQLIVMTGVERGLNYGLNRVRCTAAAPGESRIVATQTIARVEEKGSGKLVTSEVRISREDDSELVCIAEVLVLVLPGYGRL